MRLDGLIGLERKYYALMGDVSDTVINVLREEEEKARLERRFGMYERKEEI